MKLEKPPIGCFENHLLITIWEEKEIGLEFSIKCIKIDKESWK